MIKKRVAVILFLGILLTIFATTASADNSSAQDVRRYVRLTINNEEAITIPTQATTVGEFLESEEIYLNAKDILSLSEEIELATGTATELWLRRSIFVNIVIDGDDPFRFEVGPVQRAGHIIAELREEKGVNFVYDGLLSDVLTANSTFNLTSVTIREQIIPVRQPFDREIRITRGLAPNESMILQEGVFGEITSVVHISYVGGVEIERTIESVTQTRDPVTEIVLMGDDLLDAPAPTGPGTIMSVGGTVGSNEYEYVLSKIMESTAYSAQQPELSNYTASGHRAVRGVVAVDPRVIPLGTWLYIEGYGRALASDTGGAIIGNKIDLCFDTVAEAIQHGRRNVRVWILR